MQTSLYRAGLYVFFFIHNSISFSAMKLRHLFDEELLSEEYSMKWINLKSILSKLMSHLTEEESLCLLSLYHKRGKKQLL